MRPRNAFGISAINVGKLAAIARLVQPNTTETNTKLLRYFLIFIISFLGVVAHKTMY